MNYEQGLDHLRRRIVELKEEIAEFNELGEPEPGVYDLAEARLDELEALWDVFVHGVD